MDATPLPVEDSAVLYDADLSPRDMTDSENSMPPFEPSEGTAPMALGTEAPLAGVDENATDAADGDGDEDDDDGAKYPAPEPVEAWTPSIPSKTPTTVSAAAPAAAAMPASAMFDDAPAAAPALATADADVEMDAPPPLDDAVPLPTDPAATTTAATAATAATTSITAVTEDADTPPPLDAAPQLATETEAAGATASATASPDQQKRSALEDSDSDTDTDNDAEDEDVAATAAEEAPAAGDAAYTLPGTAAAARSPSERQQAKQKGPKGPTEKQRAKKRRDMEIETSKFMRDSSNCTISMKACANPGKQRTVERVLAFAQPSLPSRSRSRSTSGSVDGTKATEATINKPVFKQKRALLKRLKSEGALDTAPKLGRGMGVRLGKKVDHHKMLEDGKQIELAASFSPRKLKKLHSAEEHPTHKPKLSAAALWRQARNHAKQSLAQKQRAKIAADIALYKEDEEDFAEEEVAPEVEDDDNDNDDNDDDDGEEEEEGEEDDAPMADGEDDDSETQEVPNAGDLDEAGDDVTTDFTGKADTTQLQEMFRVFDKDGNGTISSTELRQAITELGMSVTDEEADRMISNADVDGDGNIDFAEFSKILNASAGPDPTDASAEAELADVLNADATESAKPPPAKPVAKAFSAMDFFSNAKITATAPQRAPPSLRPTTPVTGRPGTPVMGTPNGRGTPDLFESTPKHLSQHAPGVAKPKTAMLPAGQNIDAIQMSGCNTPQSIAAGQSTIRDTPNDDSQSLQSLQVNRNSEVSMMCDEQSQYLDADGLVAHRAASDGKRAVFAPRKLDTSAGSSVATKPVTTEMTATQAEAMDDLADLCSGVFPDAEDEDDEETEETEETGAAAGYFLEEAEVDSDDSEYEGAQEDEETDEAIIDDGEPLNGSDDEADMQKMQMQELAEDGETPAFLKKYMVEKDSDDSDDDERGTKRKAENDNVEEEEEKELTKEEKRALRKEKKRAKKERKERRRKRREEREAQEKEMAEENSQMDMFGDDDAATSAAALDEPDASDDEDDQTKLAARQDERQQWMASRAKEDSQMELSLMDESSQQIQKMIKRTSSSRTTSSSSQQVASVAAAANPKPAELPSRPFAAFGGATAAKHKPKARRGSFMARRTDPNIKNLLSGSGIGKSKSGKSNQGYAFKVTSRDGMGNNGDSQPSESSKPKSGFGPSAFSGIGQKTSKASDALLSKAPKRPALASLGQGGKSGASKPKSAFGKRSSVLMKAINSKPRK